MDDTGATERSGVHGSVSVLAIFTVGKLMSDATIDAVAKAVIRKRMAQPSIETLERWSSNGIAKATDGCEVEPDGTCMHGCPSWLVELGFI